MAKKTSYNGSAKKSPRKDSKTAKVATMLARPNGCTRKEVLIATGWTAVAFAQMAAAAGRRLKTDKAEWPYRYRI